MRKDAYVGMEFETRFFFSSSSKDQLRCKKEEIVETLRNLNFVNLHLDTTEINYYFQTPQQKGTLKYTVVLGYGEMGRLAYKRAVSHDNNIVANLEFGENVEFDRLKEKVMDSNSPAILLEGEFHWNAVDNYRLIQKRSKYVLKSKETSLRDIHCSIDDIIELRPNVPLHYVSVEFETSVPETKILQSLGEVTQKFQQKISCVPTYNDKMSMFWRKEATE
ncbi:hypothetical protein [Lactiplantibacillus pentosus]|uniref:hypothetical protein n=1 Tax=Lactiplantibacillus pentosus TaxID=1589 RepID=UPI0021A5B73A|nr:hypothetical protein [Lactiplantibacillus pentosus]MCT3286897.1 hypothetical protein [Lactiplantibacillus pentosus]WFC03551.1 hypothetical protein PGN10_00955 [Lactiplantibacillus pentosus]